MPSLRMTVIAMAGTFLLAAPVSAAQPPPNSMPLSQIIQMIEQRGEVVYFDEIEWDNNGYWEVEYVAKDGSKRKVRIDPISGQVRQ